MTMTDRPSLADAALVCALDGTIIPIGNAFACPDLEDRDFTQAEVLQHIDNSGISVASLVGAVSAIHQLLDGKQCDSDTIASIVEILQDQLSLEIRDPLHASEPPAT